MTDSLLTPPDRCLNAATVRRTILLQHDLIRELLAHAHAVAKRALDQKVQSPDAVAKAIADIQVTYDVHLTFEEKVSSDRFDDDPSSGPLRAARLREDHSRQRATLSKLDAEAKAGPFVPLLAAKLAFLTTWLLDDMAREEHTVLASDRCMTAQTLV